MAPNFPGMNPYLENPSLWSEVHSWLIVELARSLNPLLIPKYRAAVENLTEEITERYLEIREIKTGKVITVVEFLSPKNKRVGEGQEKYLTKRQKVLNSVTHLVEIDLLRMGNFMPMDASIPSDYRILVSRANLRPEAELYPFNLRESIPQFLFPLQPLESEPIVNLSEVLAQIYQEAALDLAIDYSQQPVPPLSESDFQWVRSLTES
ncbi:hypothetical protein BCD67_12130 [Oscillatoriales cyanobacterium USR001]|nr:hypothetical protein BCD67_12130 [Oscillatoriales cyanobacterium USR001]